MAGPARVEVGFVARAHGVRGELRIVLHNPSSRALDRATQLFIGEAAHAVKSLRAVDGAVLVAVDGIADRDRAEALKGRPVAVAREALGLAAGEYLLVDLVGLAVETIAGEPWGEVVAVEVGAQDRLVIHHDGVERLLPAVAPLLASVDLARGRVVVDPPVGLPESPVRRR